MLNNIRLTLQLGILIVLKKLITKFLGEP